MDKRFSSMFGLSEAESILLLDTPLGQLPEGQSRYVAACELVNFPTEAAIQALIRAVQNPNPELDNRIVRRKSIETLGRLSAVQALPMIRDCLGDEDCYTVENAVWAIGEIGTDDAVLLEQVAQLLETPNQTYRVIIHTLAKLGYEPAVARIKTFVDDEDTTIASAAMTAIARLTGDRTPLSQVVEFLLHPNVYTRRLAIQDLIDAQHDEAIPAIARTPVSLVFRLRGIRMLADAGTGNAGTNQAKSAGIDIDRLNFATDIQPWLEQVLWDRPEDLTLVHEYDQPPTLEFLINELYQTDFGRCYLAVKTILAEHREIAPAALMVAYQEKARADYGGHYHVMKLLGRLHYEPAFELMVQEGLNNPQPQFQKSRFAAALSLGELGNVEAIPALKACLDSPIWTIKYAALMALEKLGDRTAHDLAAQDSDWLIRAKATSM
ncbi:MAG: HEAT repeat domain-containing protein [Synechococcales cyanobacterium CRU_2_2]|nr:HEAT repeat domain-containing protein [Synechococcales cyanobacterium CRU_2_2]